MGYKFLVADLYGGGSTDMYISHLFGLYSKTAVWSVGCVFSGSFWIGSTEPIAGIPERNPKSTKTDHYFQFPTIAYVFWEGGGNFHPKCNTSVEALVMLECWASLNRTEEDLIPEFGHPLHWNIGTKTGVLDPNRCVIYMSVDAPLIRNTKPGSDFKV
jgi:hypothetical protein